MKLIDKIKAALGRKESKIEIRGELSGTNWAEISMTNFIGESVTLGTPVTNMSIRIQTLASGAKCFSAQDCRIDNAHGFLHKHSGASIFPMVDKTMSGALLALFDKDYEVLENQAIID